MRERRFTRVVTDLLVACPAGEPIGETYAGSGCRCHIERSNITAGTDATALVAYCLSGYQACPTWRAEKERILAHQMSMAEEVATENKVEGVRDARHT